MKESKIILQANVIGYLAKNKPETDDREWRENVGYVLKCNTGVGVFTQEEAIELAIHFTTW